MTTIDLATITSSAVYDRHVAELAGFATTAASRTPSAPHPKINRASIARVALCWAAGVLAPGAVRVVGDPRWDGPDAPDLSAFPAELPRAVHLSDDLLGHVEIHAAVKIAHRMCAAEGCDNTFTVRRGARTSARWPTGCSAACKHTIRMQRQRERRAREVS